MFFVISGNSLYNFYYFFFNFEAKKLQTAFYVNRSFFMAYRTHFYSSNIWILKPKKASTCCASCYRKTQFFNFYTYLCKVKTYNQILVQFLKDYLQVICIDTFLCKNMFEFWSRRKSFRLAYGCHNRLYSWYFYYIKCFNFEAKMKLPTVQKTDNQKLWFFIFIFE